MEALTSTASRDLARVLRGVALVARHAAVDVEKFGFKNTKKDLKKDFFYFLDFEKVQDIKKKKKLPEIALKPCLYKKR